MNDGSPLLAGYRGVVCDLDGVVYRGKDPVEDAQSALRDCLESGVPVVFATNNAARLPGVVAAQLNSLGIAIGEDQVLTSSQASAAYLSRELAPGARVLAVGGEGVSAALTEYGLTPVAPRENGDVEAVLQGYGAEVTAADLAETSRMVSQGRRWVATNPDLTLPNEWGLGPGCGAFLAVVTIATGRRPDVTIGKPHPPLYLECAGRLELPAHALLAIGDRLDTDIDGAAAAGMDCVWVLTGVDDIVALVTHPEHATPTYVMTTLAGLHRPYARPVADPANDAEASCDGLGMSLVDSGGQLEWAVSGDSPGDEWDRRNAVLRGGLSLLLARRERGLDGHTLVRLSQQLATLR